MKLSTALCAFVLCVCSLIFTGITVVLEQSAATHQKEEAGRITAMMQTRMLASVTGRLSHMESDVQSIARVAPTPDKLFENSGVEKLLAFMVNNDSLMIGASLAYNPGSLPGHKDPWMYYMKQGRNGLAGRQLYGTGYDYLDAEWFAGCVETGKKQWSAPYYDKGGGDCMMTTFSCPLHGNDGKVYAVLTADVALDSIFSFVKSLRPYPGSRTYIIDKEGSVIDVAGSGVENNDDALILSSVQCVVSTNGFADGTIDVGGKQYIVNYASLPHKDAVVCTVSPYDEVAGSFRSLKTPLIMVVGLGFILLLGGIWLVFRFGSRPLCRLTLAAERIAGGDFNAPLPESMRYVDLERMRDAMQKMEESIQGHIMRRAEELAERRRIKDELEMAAYIQRSMLPDIDRFASPSLKVAAILRPALEVSGDFYDIVSFGSISYFIIADVSGKGMPASLVMASVRSLFRFAADLSMDPGEILHRINRQLADGNDGCMFVTAIAGMVDTSAGRVILSNAGHVPPVVIGKGAGLVSLPVALPLGVLDDTCYEETEISLGGGELLLLYTDGVTEAEDAAGRQFGSENLLAALDGSPMSRFEPSYVVNVIDRSVRTFSPRKRGDDVTLLCIQVVVRHDMVELPYEISKLDELTCFVESFGKSAGWDDRMIMNVNIAFEEAVSNIMIHSEAPDKDAVIEVQLEQGPGFIRGVVIDNGKMYNPLLLAIAPDISATVDERPVGGLGIHMIRKLSKKLSYEYKDKKNILTIIF